MFMPFARKRGFTLIEILLVVVIIGIMLAVIVPRAWRANVDTKYGLVRQAATELASFGTGWAEEQIMAQTSDSTSTFTDYLKTLAGGTTAGTAEFIGENNSNWNNRGNLEAVPGRNGATVNDPPEASVQDLVPPEKVMRNPFNGVEYFLSPNAPSGWSWSPRGHCLFLAT
jgi:prepilin-type N-terminal cleavage/methylation domain-containing protein